MKAKPVGGGGGYKKPKSRSTASKIAGVVGTAALGPLTSSGRKAMGKVIGAAHPYNIVKHLPTVGSNSSPKKSVPKKASGPVKSPMAAADKANALAAAKKKAASKKAAPKKK